MITRLEQLKKDLADIKDRIDHCSWGMAEILADEQNDIQLEINKLQATQ
tara:strand:+ start:334 stop:480 length:147 start_codon:yes stop_codon:yes gene_type:complete